MHSTVVEEACAASSRVEMVICMSRQPSLVRSLSFNQTLELDIGKMTTIHFLFFPSPLLCSHQKQMKAIAQVD